MNYFKLILEAQKNLVENPQDYAHEITHHYRVWSNAKLISDEIPDFGNFDELELICWWHDVKVPLLDYSSKRVNAVIAEYLANKLPQEYREIVVDGIINHEWGSTPKFEIGKVLQDADKLDLLSNERLTTAINASKNGLMDIEIVRRGIETIYNDWLAKMPERYNFEISRKMHEERLGSMFSYFEALELLENSR